LFLNMKYRVQQKIHIIETFMRKKLYKNNVGHSEILF
jgi:hypothetical protein